ncbi:MAG: glycyl-radical enzyme activating protein [Melioribacteraceae bacterium]|nr:glycyl-radical enzyme activating protein [Melioribacteraceae bacterium]
MIQKKQCFSPELEPLTCNLKQTTKPLNNNSFIYYLKTTKKDPSLGMMKGNIFDIKKFAIHDGPGIRTTVFLTGCPLDCWWCHNPESLRKVNSSNETNKEVSVEYVIQEIEKDIIFYDESGGGATFSGGEPLVQFDFLYELLKNCKRKNIHTCIDTSGYAPFEKFEKIVNLADIILFDIKLIDDELHKKYTGVSNKLILENLKKLTEHKNKVIVRVPLIPNVTDTKVNLDKLVKYISSLKNIIKVDLLPYNKIGEAKYNRFDQELRLGKLEIQSEDKLEEIKSNFDSLGIETSFRG